MDGFQVTDVKIRVAPSGRLKAFATLTICGCFVVRDVKIIEGNNGLFVAMPSRRKSDGSHRDVAHPLNAECRDYVENCVLTAYDNAFAGVDESQSLEVKA